MLAAVQYHERVHCFSDGTLVPMDVLKADGEEQQAHLTQLSKMEEQTR